MADEFAFLQGNTQGDIMSALSEMDPVANAMGKPSAFLASMGIGADGAPLPAGEPSPEELLLGTEGRPAATAVRAVAEGPGGGAAAAAAEAGAGDELDRMFPFMAQSGTRPQIQNVVSMFSLGTQLNLKDIALRAKNAEYNPKRFAAVIMRIREPKSTALLFESGKVVVTGASDEDASKQASKRFAKIVRKLGYQAKFKDFRVKFPIRLEMMAAENALFSSYEPELFPGLIFRMENPKVVLLIFVSGKIVLTGARSRNDVYASFNKIFPLLMKYDKNKSAKTAASAVPPPLPPAPKRVM